jgi:hypothetical protein
MVFGGTNAAIWRIGAIGEGRIGATAVSSDEDGDGSAMQTDLSERARELMLEALRLLDEAREAFAAAHLAQAIETLGPPERNRAA